MCVRRGQRMTLDLVPTVHLAWRRVSGLLSALYCMLVALRASHLCVRVLGSHRLAVHILLLHGL